MYIFIVAGELSGDEICAKLVDLLRSKFSDIDIRGMFGSKTEQMGLKSLWKMSDISLLGFAEVIPSLFKVLCRIRDVRDYILKTKPDIVITIDSYGFCIRLAKKIREVDKDIKLYHIVAPSVWAYKKGRAAVISRYYNKLFCFLPFEPKYFTKYGLDAIYVGYPAVHDLNPKQSVSDKNLIVITVGSRVDEVRRHLPVIKLVIAKLTSINIGLKFFIPTADTVKDIMERELVGFDNIVLGGHIRDEVDVISKASFIISKIGTNVAELAMFKIPILVYYFVNFYTSLILRFLLKIKFVSLINIVSGHEVMSEVVGSTMNVTNNANMIVSKYIALSSNLDAILKQKIEIESVISSLRMNNHPIERIVSCF